MSPALAGLIIAAVIIAIVLGGHWLERHLAQTPDTEKDPS